MKTLNRMILSLILFITAASCRGSGESLSESGVPGIASPVSREQPSQSNTLSGSSEVSGHYPTTDHGSFSLLRIRTLDLPSGSILRGVTASGGLQFILLETQSSGGFSRWKIYANNGEDDVWAVQCDILSDGGTRIGIGVDENNFYLPGSSGEQRYSYRSILKVNRSNCTRHSVIDSSISFPSSGDVATSFTVSVADGVLYWSESINQLRTRALNFLSLIVTTQTSIPTLGGRSLYNFRAVHRSRDEIWALDTGPYLWKLRTDGSPISWGRLPSDDYSDLGYHLRGVTPLGLNTLVVMTNGSFNTGGGAQATRLRFYYFDVSRF